MQKNDGVPERSVVAVADHFSDPLRSVETCKLNDGVPERSVVAVSAHFSDPLRSVETCKRMRVCQRDLLSQYQLTSVTL